MGLPKAKAPDINPEILPWARKTMGLTVEQAARKLDIKPENLVAYEEGRKKPSRPAVLNMTKIYHRPLLVFFLKKPPKTGNHGIDFRTLPSQDKGDAYTDGRVDALIRDIMVSQSLTREALLEENEGVRLDFVGQCTLSQGVDHVARALKDVLALDLGQFRRQPDYKKAFDILRDKAETAGMFVVLKGNLGSHHTNIDVKRFRGFALADDIAPFIVINDTDAQQAWSFTLLHEIVHILLGETGISSTSLEQAGEKFCNDVASQFLLPQQEFATFRKDPCWSREAFLASLNSYAFSKKISSTHVLYRLYKRGDIDKKEWHALQDFYREQWENAKQKKKNKDKSQGGPSFYTVRRYKLGNLARQVKRFNQSGSLSVTRAAMVLGVHPLSVHRLLDTG